jgi:hypothetical protein
VDQSDYLIGAAFHQRKAGMARFFGLEKIFFQVKMSV